MDATRPPKRTTFARPNAVTARSPNILIRTMNALTATSLSAPVDGSTRATSVTWTDDQSTAVPSARPKLNAMAPSSTANAGTRGPASGPLTVLIPAVNGTHREIATQATTETALSVMRAGVMTAAPPPASRAMRTTADAPARFPTLKPACSLLITGFTRACSTRTPRAFIETSMAPLPSPANAADAAASGRLRAKARAATPAIKSADAGSTTLLAPRLSARRPPICMDTSAAAASETSTTASPPASTPNRSRRAGNVAPKPPTRVPFTAKRPATATKGLAPARSGMTRLPPADEHRGRGDAKARDREDGTHPTRPLVAVTRVQDHAPQPCAESIGHVECGVVERRSQGLTFVGDVHEPGLQHRHQNRGHHPQQEHRHDRGQLVVRGEAEQRQDDRDGRQTEEDPPHEAVCRDASRHKRPRRHSDPVDREDHGDRN